MTEDEKWMHYAIIQANIANDKGEVPVGSIIVQNNKIIAKYFISEIEFSCARQRRKF